MSEVTPGDERSILDATIRSVTDLWPEPLDEVHDIPPLRNAILAAGFRRVSPVTREAVKQMLAENGFTPNGGHPHSWRCEHPDRYPGACRCVDEMTDDIMRLLSVSPPAEVTDEMVERGVEAMYQDAHPDKPWADLSPTFKSLYRSHVRAALMAVLASVTPGEGKEQ